MKKENAVVVAFLLLLLSYIILADETSDFSWDDITSYTETSYPAHTFVYCDNFYRKEKNYTLRYPKVLNLDAVKQRPGELDEGGLTLMSKYNYIEKIENGAFDNYTNLRTLGIMLNSLQYIDDKVLTEKVATSLYSLSLKSNNLQNLPTTAFQYLTNLQALDLSYNAKINLWVMFNGINLTVFHEALKKVVYLDISYCNIGHFDDNVFANLKKLQMLRMSGNPITSVPVAIKVLTTLEDLHIKDSKIAKIVDCDFCNLTKLRTLDLSNTKSLSFIHENAFGGISNTPQLKEFSIQSCNIQIIPEKFLNWKMLDKLDIRHNPLKCDSSNAWLINDIVTASPSLLTSKVVKSWNWSDKNFLACNSPTNSKWSLLHILFGNMCFNGTAVYDESEKYESDVYYVCDNKETERFPCKVSNDHELKCYSEGHLFSDSRGTHHFDYSFHSANIKILQKNLTLYNVDFEGKWEWNTKLTVLQKGKVLPGHESTIKTLSFKNNKIHTIENGTFDKFISLEILHLSYNEVRDIDGLTFPPSLTQLYIIDNQLKLTSSKPFENLVHLDTLSLPENPNILPVNSTTTVFPAALSNLKTLSLRRCNITMLDDSIFVDLVSLENLYVGENPLTSIPTAINALQKLKILNIQSSPNMTVINGVGLVTNPSLIEIFASYSKIERIDDCALCSFPNLKYFDLSFNSELSYIHENAFCNEKSCQRHLSLDGCDNLAVPELPIPEVCGFRPVEVAIVPRKEDQNTQNSKENDSKDVDEKELQKVSGDNVDVMELSPYDMLMVIFVLSAGVLVILW